MAVSRCPSGVYAKVMFLCWEPDAKGRLYPENERSLATQVLPAVAQGGVLFDSLAVLPSGRDGGDCLEVTERRQSHDQSAPCARSNRPQPHRPGKKASKRHLLVDVAPRCY